MRALLVVNPKATTTTPRSREVLKRALASELKVEVVETSHRGHAAALAVRAMREGLDVVVALGGDGTVNEVVNGLLTDGPQDDLPALAVVPGGSTNVFVRAVGLPTHPFDATGAILEALRAGRTRRIGLGLADDRYFTFNAGLGFDADVVRRIEKRRRAGDPPSHARFVRAALTHYATVDRRHPAITLERPGQKPVDHLHFALVTNTAPWTYLGERPVQPSPEASFDAGLDLFAPRSMGILLTLRYVRRALLGSSPPRSRRLLRVHDLAEFTLRASRPLALQVDGDWLGERESVRFRSVPDVLRVIV
ncbi:MAG TPA: diacylglycerol kinase family protein [Mycobacteriales bacterium]|nr:diacylglycerol kinase family protein [Mycobacteriales bacterium]